MIGENIKKLRLKKGLTLRELGDILGVSHQTISKYEKNQMMPSSPILIKLAKVLEVKVAYLLQNDTDNIEIKEIHYRKNSSFNKKNQEIVENITKDSLSSYLQVLDLFPNERFSMPNLNNLIQEVDNYEQIEEAANKLRAILNLGEDPINNLLLLLEDLGFIVIFIDKVTGFDGKEGKVNEIPFIILSKDKSGDRQRFNLAHELGHLLIKHKDLDDEEVAHRFAGAFLVPKATLIKDLGEKRKSITLFELKKLKDKYKVSIQCLLMRANQTGIISDYEKQKLFKEISYLGWRKQEPIMIENEVSYKFQKMVCEAVSEEYISESKGAEYLNISTIKFLEEYMERRVNANN